ncbi:outer membrane protein, multidrug efflux system [Albimonas donghaensis]|uniref:Outer membrane protein, multidrug efflux system n=1 Tax=Albimonas donghaensis TaxID=356660 RepID=A0A1H3BWR9_9RHOB|nr:efflux transporter outer membrane subunit [Albimonas donghaensis]SDX46303.1 outer membrane protein, multidrug efflux system [Albimonas donghaensis]
MTAPVIFAGARRPVRSAWRGGLVAAGAAAALVACAPVGPDFAAPEADLSPAFVDPLAKDLAAEDQAAGAVSAPTPVIGRAWWLDYGDPMLESLVVAGVGANLTEAAARERIAQARANLRATGINAALDGGLDASALRSGGDEVSTTGTGAGALGAALVVDLFGGIRRGRESAEASLDSGLADVETARLAWLAELVAAYSDARFNQAALALTRAAIASRQETVDITRRQLEAGAATEYGVATAEALLDTARANLPAYAALFNANVFAIATLLDAPAGPLLARMQAGAPQLRAPSGDPVIGVPADLLRNRPDLRAAEADLHAAVADVGVAEAALYPSITLTGDLSLNAGSSGWSFGPTLSLPVFNRGALEASRDAQVSLARQAEIAWRAAVVDAVADVQVAQSNLDQYRRRATALRRAADSYGRALDLARVNYREGAITLLDLLVTDGSAVTARINQASAVNDAAKEWAALQIALGAGSRAGAGARPGS